MARFGLASPLIAGLALLAAVVAGFVAFGSAPARAQAGDSHRGSALAQSWCASCHVIDSNGAGRSSDNAPPFPVIAADKSKTPDLLRSWMTAEHTRMPNFNLSRREIDDLIAYIRSLAAK